jgi:hypothetical protein
MLNLEKKTKLETETAIRKLKEYFGKGGLGLELASESPQCLSFEGGGGYVTAILCPEKKGSRIQFETREWELHVRKFAEQLK